MADAADPVTSKFASVDSNEATRIRFVNDAKSLRSTPFNDTNSVHPDLTHQLFDDEKIFGYKNPQLLFYFTPATLTPYYEFSHDGLEAMSLPTQTAEARGAKRFLQTIFFKRPKTEEPKDVDVSDVLRTQPRDAVGPALHSAANDMASFVKAVEADRTAEMPGTEVATFEVGGRLFSVRRATFDDPAAATLVSRLDILIKMFVDGGSPILPHPNWHLLFVFERASTGPALAGYTCLYEDYLHPRSAALKLCQILVLPHYRGLGVCTQLLSAARKETSVTGCGEFGLFTFNEPSEQLQTVRMTIDAALLEAHLGPSPAPTLAELSTEDVAGPVAKALRVEPFAVRRAALVLRLKASFTPTAAWTTDLRRCMMAENHDDLAAVDDREARLGYIGQLAEAYTAMMGRAAAAVDRVAATLD